MKTLQEGLEWVQCPNVLPAPKVKDQNEEESFSQDVQAA